MQVKRFSLHVGWLVWIRYVQKWEREANLVLLSACQYGPAGKEKQSKSIRLAVRRSSVSEAK